MSVWKWLSNFVNARIHLAQARVDLAYALVENDQLKFLLESAPMIDMNPEYFKRAVTKFAYISPKTMIALQPDTACNYVSFPPAPTMWLLLPLMPEGRVIFSQTKPPHLERPNLKQGLVK